MSGADIAVVHLEDGSLATLRPRTVLYRVDDNLYLVEGEALFDVTSDSRRTFRVQTSHGEIRVLGTRFDVSTWGERTTVFLERGTVAFLHRSTGTVDTLSPGYELVASPEALRVGPAPNNGEGSIDWLDRTLILGERPLTLILAEMEHHFGIEVLVPDSLEKETLSGRIQLSSLGQSLSDLGIALGGRFEQDRPNVFRLSPQ